MMAFHSVGLRRRGFVVPLAVLLMVSAPAFSEEIQGHAECGAFSADYRSGVFSVGLCDGRWQASGRYDQSEIHIDRIAGAQSLVAADWSYPVYAWPAALQHLSATVAALGITIDRLTEAGKDLSGNEHVSAGSTLRCNEGPPGFHILDPSVNGSVQVGENCVAVAVAVEPLNLDTLWVNGTLDSHAPIVARAALVTGGRIAAPDLVVGHLSAKNGEVESANLETQGLEAEGSRLLVSETFKVHAPQHEAGARVRLDKATVVTAKHMAVDAMTLRGEAQVLVDATLQSNDVTLSQAKLMAGQLEVGALTADGSEISVGRLRGNQAGTIELRSSRMRAEDLAVRLFHATNSELTGTEFQAEGVRLESTTVQTSGEKLRLSAGGLNLNASEVKGGRYCEIIVGGQTDIRETRIEAGTIDAALGDARVDNQSVFQALALAPYRSRQLPMDDGEAVADLSGASHGGYGGTAGSLAGNRFVPAEEPLGNPRLEEPLAGRGGWGLAEGDPPLDLSTGGAGGGVLVIRAEHLEWQGLGSANGGMAPPHGIAGTPFLRWGGGGGGGAGGSIVVEVAGRLSGNGAFQANGGAGTYGVELGYFSGGGGSGGRMRIGYGDKAGWTGSATALGGPGARHNPDALSPGPTTLPWTHRFNHGGPGTVYWKPLSGPGMLVIDGREGPGGVGRLSGDFSDDDIYIADAVVTTSGLKARNLRLTDGAVLTADNPRARLQWPPPRAYPVPKGHAVHALAGAENRYPEAVGKIPLEARVEVVVSNDLQVGSHSAIDVSGFGGYSRAGNNGDRSGGSHGGLGGTGGLEPVRFPAAAAYGDPRQPLEVGLGGAGAHGFDEPDPAKCALGGAGGGALRLTVGATLTLEGAIRADGQAGVDDTHCVDVQGTGGGAGGSLWITAGTITGTGVISASGARGGLSKGAIGGGGGGGRIALYHSLGRFDGAVLADGGSGQAIEVAETKGQPGSIVTGPAPDADANGVLDGFDVARQQTSDNGGGGESLFLGLMALLARLLGRRPR